MSLSEDQISGVLTGLPALSSYQQARNGPFAVHNLSPCSTALGTPAEVGSWVEYTHEDSTGLVDTVQMAATQMPSPAEARSYVSSFATYVAQCGKDPLLPGSAGRVSSESPAPVSRPRGADSLAAFQFNGPRGWEQVAFSSGTELLSVGVGGFSGDSAAPATPGLVGQVVGQLAAAYAAAADRVQGGPGTGPLPPATEPSTTLQPSSPPATAGPSSTPVTPYSAEAPSGSNRYCLFSQATAAEILANPVVGQGTDPYTEDCTYQGGTGNQVVDGLNVGHGGITPFSCDPSVQAPHSTVTKIGTGCIVSIVDGETLDEGLWFANGSTATVVLDYVQGPVPPDASSRALEAAEAVYNYEATASS